MQNDPRFVNRFLKFIPGILVGVIITLSGSIGFFWFQQRHGEERFRHDYNLLWTVNNTAMSHAISFLKLFNLSKKNYVTKEIGIINAGNKPLHNVYVKILFKKKIIAHSACDNDPLPFYDRNNQIVNDTDTFKGKDALDIHFSYFPPQASRTILISLDEEIAPGTEETVLRKRQPLADIVNISISADEVNGTPIAK